MYFVLNKIIFPERNDGNVFIKGMMVMFLLIHHINCVYFDYLRTISLPIS